MHAVVTGASRGIGEAVTRELIARGCRVTMVARTVTALDTIAAETGAAAVPMDLASGGGMDTAIAGIETQHGPIDILINNAALGDVAPFLELPVDASRRHINANLIAPMEMTRQVLPGMVERRRGTIVNVCSLAGEIATRNAAPYATSKAGLSMFTSYLHRELRKSPVTPLLLLLGEVDTAILEQVRADPVMSIVAKRVGKLRALTPQQVATKLADAIEKDKRILVLPPAARPILGVRHVPSRLMDLAMIGVR
ncbi:MULTISPECIES: SDR family NAD(P)-dependent oxidoreductase [Mycobacterium]|nr:MULTISPECIES: SDR family NAD(P)-dependent oxidoreductase [Mycobacterium]